MTPCGVSERPVSRPKMTISPLVSVVCAVHNALPYLPEAMQSILSQTFSDLELIIVDDASTDGTVDYVKSLDNPRVRLIRREKSNLSEALNAGIADARADLIARIDGDDIALPHRIENQYRFMTDTPAVELADRSDSASMISARRKLDCNSSDSFPILIQAH